jgi:hypothetical protein
MDGVKVSVTMGQYGVREACGLEIYTGDVLIWISHLKRKWRLVFTRSTVMMPDRFIAIRRNVSPRSA